MESPAENRCPECGAPDRDGMTCREKYEAMLAHEFEHPQSFGAVHHLTVASYNLQHPGPFTAQALEWMRASLTSAVKTGEPPQEWRRRASKQFRGKDKPKVVRKPGDAQPAGQPTPPHWTMTAADIPLDGPEVYIAGIQVWARAIVADLDAQAS